MSFVERLSLSGQMTLQGLGTVFLVLALLWGAMVLFKLFLHDIPNKRKKQVPSETAQEASEAAAAAPETQKTAQDEGALIAVITAAVIAARTEQGVADAEGFRVVSFKRTGR